MDTGNLNIQGELTDNEIIKKTTAIITYYVDGYEYTE